MIQCVSDHTPYDDEPDVIEEAEAWLKRHPENPDYRETCQTNYAREVIEGLLEFIKDEI
jgi:hypothetical protein